MPTPLTLNIITRDADHAYSVDSAAELRPHLDAASARQGVEAWLDLEGDGFSYLTNYPHRRAVLFCGTLHSVASDFALSAPWMRAVLDEYDDEFDDADEVELEFLLANGQADGYPARWTVPLEDAKRAMEYFLEQGELAPFVQWSED